MAKVPFTSWLQGPNAIYTSSTGQSDLVTGVPYLGTDFQESYFADLSYADSLVWSKQYNNLAQMGWGRVRIVRIASDAVAANILPNQPVGWATGPVVASVGFTAGSGYTNGTYNLTSSASGSQVAAVVQVVVSGGAIISASILQQGNGFLTTAPPTFSLTALGGGTGGVVTAQLQAAGNLVTSYSSVAASVTSLPRGIALCNPGPTSTQVLAGAWILIQELGVAPVQMPASPGSTTSGAQIVAVSGGTTQSQTPAYSGVEIGFATIPPAASQIIPVQLTLPDLPF